MLTKSGWGKIALTGVLCVAFLIQPVTAHAWWRDRGGWGWGGGWGWPVAAVAVGATATALWISGHQYYYYDGAYYDNTPYGYVVVNPPVVTTVVGPVAPTVVQAAPSAPSAVAGAAVQSQAPVDDVITLNIPNDKGGYVVVALKRSGNGFVGPQGEFYSEFPKVSQLKLMYAK